MRELAYTATWWFAARRVLSLSAYGLVFIRHSQLEKGVRDDQESAMGDDRDFGDPGDLGTRDDGIGAGRVPL